MNRKRGLDDSDSDSDEEEEDVYYYIAITGGQEWGRHEGEAAGAFPFSIPTTNYSNTASDRVLNQQYHAYWMNLVRRRGQQPRNSHLEPTTDLERAVRDAQFQSRLEAPSSVEIARAPNVTARAIAHFQQVARVNQQTAAAAFLEEYARERASKARRFTPSPAPTTPGRPPISLPRGAARTALQQAVRQVGIAGGQGVAAATQGALAQLERLNLEDPSGARNRFGRALRTPNLSVHKRNKYTKIYNALSHLLL